MHDLSNISYDDAVNKLATWYQQKRASIGEGVGRLGEWISNNPGTAATIGGGALGGLIGGAADGPDGWRGRVRRSLTGAVAGAGIGGGGALAVKSLLGGHPAAASGSVGPKFEVNGKKMQFDPKAVAANPDLSAELGSLNEATPNEVALGGLRTGWNSAMTYAPITTAVGLPAVAMREIYHHGTKMAPGSGKGVVADLHGSTKNWDNYTENARNSLMAETKKTLDKGVSIPEPHPDNVRFTAVNKMISDAAGRKVNPVEANQHVSVLSKLRGFLPKATTGPGGRVSFQGGGFRGVYHQPPQLKLKPAGSFRGRALAPLAISGLADILRAAYLGNVDDQAKKQRLLSIVRQHAKPVQE